MKRSFLLLLLITAIIATNCKKKSDDTPVTPTVTASDLAVVGTNWTSGTGSLAVVQASGSDVVVRGIYQGDTMAVAGSMTTTGMADYFYSSGDKTKPFTLVNYADPVGTQYKYTLGTVQVVRTVTHVSTTDDTYIAALGMYIKTNEVKEDVPAGLTVNGKECKTKTIYWTLNHRFGVVYARVIQTDGTEIDFPLSGTNAGAKK